MNYKICFICHENKKITEFPKHPKMKDGHLNKCKICTKNYLKKYYDKNKDTMVLKMKEWRNNNKEYKNSIDNKYYWKNRDRCRKLQSEYYIDTRNERIFRVSMYRAKLLNAIPAWLSIEQQEEIKNMYLNCPSGFEVDHIVPLKGKNVRGLHIAYNLQYLTNHENNVKHNKVL